MADFGWQRFAEWCARPRRIKLTPEQKRRWEQGGDQEVWNEVMKEQDKDKEVMAEIDAKLMVRIMNHDIQNNADTWKLILEEICRGPIFKIKPKINEEAFKAEFLRVSGPSYEYLTWWERILKKVRE